MKRFYIIIGPPGSGKGTQAKKVSDKLGVPFIGTGDLLRKEITSGSDLGKTFQSIIDKGNLLSDQMINDYFDGILKNFDISNGAVIDGYPRTVGQAEHLSAIINNEELIAIYLNVSTESLIKRLSIRRICGQCSKIFIDPGKNLKNCDKCHGLLIQREDDKPEVVRERIEIYKRQTAPIIKYYEEKIKLVEINGEPDIEEVYREIQQKLSKNP